MCPDPNFSEWNPMAVFYSGFSRLAKCLCERALDTAGTATGNAYRYPSHSWNSGGSYRGSVTHSRYGTQFVYNQGSRPYSSSGYPNRPPSTYDHTHNNQNSNYYSHGSYQNRPTNNLYNPFSQYPRPSNPFSTDPYSKPVSNPYPSIPSVPSVPAPAPPPPEPPSQPHPFTTWNSGDYSRPTQVIEFNLQVSEPDCTAVLEDQDLSQGPNPSLKIGGCIFGIRWGGGLGSMGTPYTCWRIGTRTGVPVVHSGARCL